MDAFLGEILGTFLLILLGGTVNANVSLKDTKGNSSGWIVITFGWGLSVFVAVFVVAGVSGAHLNPAVTIGLALAGKFSWDLVAGYLLAQLIGAFLGAMFTWIQFKDHFDRTEDSISKLGVFSTIPAIPNKISNLISEILGTFVLVLGVLYVAAPDVGLGALDALPVALLVVVIGMGMGGTTGYAINPARDLGPRIAHFILPIKEKGSSDWGYSWIPVLGPIIGAAIASLVFLKLPF